MHASRIDDYFLAMFTLAHPKSVLIYSNRNCSIPTSPQRVGFGHGLSGVAMFQAQSPNLATGPQQITCKAARDFHLTPSKLTTNGNIPGDQEVAGKIIFQPAQSRKVKASKGDVASSFIYAVISFPCLDSEKLSKIMNP